MRNNGLVTVWLVGLLLAGCSSDGAVSDRDAGAESTRASSSTPATDTSPPTTQRTESSLASTTAPPSTLPPGPPVFDQRTLGDNLLLSSFVLTVSVGNTIGGQLNENVTTTGFIKDPLSVYELATFSSGGTTDGTRSYLVGGRSYEENQFGDWYLGEAGSATNYSHDLDLRSGTLAGLASARLAGQEDFAGIPANHFVFDETDLVGYSSYSPANPGPTVEGDFYLAQEGNYVLYTHSKETSPDQTYEVTEALSSVGQVPPITLPADLASMTQALDIGAGLSSLLPPGSSLRTMIRYKNGIGVDYYDYATTVRTNDELMNFFRALPPTNGWVVSHVGHIRPHVEPTDCETSVECVILENGGEQIVVSFDGGITVEYDRDHVFSPL